MNVKDLLERKSGGIITVRASITILEAIDTMTSSKVGALLIESDDNRLIGIVTERDILRLCAANHGQLENVQLADVMTSDLIVGTPECSIDEAMSLMTEHRFRHLPIMEGGQAVGVISIGDLVKAKLKDVSVEVKYLRDYISA